MKFLSGARGRKLGKPLPYAFFGPYGMREIGDRLRIPKNRSST